MVERRRASRHKSFLKGKIYFNNRRASIDCLVRDFSETGARLKFSAPVTTPDVVELALPNKNEAYRAKVQWHTGDEMGVSFVENDDAQPADSDAAATRGVTARLQKLEEEVSKLRKTTNELRADLLKLRGIDE